MTPHQIGRFGSNSRCFNMFQQHHAAFIFGLTEACQESPAGAISLQPLGRDTMDASHDTMTELSWNHGILKVLKGLWGKYMKVWCRKNLWIRFSSSCCLLQASSKPKWSGPPKLDGAWSDKWNRLVRYSLAQGTPLCRSSLLSEAHLGSLGQNNLEGVNSR